MLYIGKNFPHFCERQAWKYVYHRNITGDIMLCKFSEFVHFGKPCIVSPDFFGGHVKFYKKVSKRVNSELSNGADTICTVIFDFDESDMFNFTLQFIVEWLKVHYRKIVLSLRNIFSAYGLQYISYSSKSPLFLKLSDIDGFNL